MSRAEHPVTLEELQRILSGKDGSDLRRTEGGWRLIDVTPGSLAERLGGKNGDVVESINGVRFDTASKGYEAAYAAIKAQRIELAGHRDGEPFVITLSLAGS
jgi:S1-C subfamily serine protease